MGFLPQIIIYKSVRSPMASPPSLIYKHQTPTLSPSSPRLRPPPPPPPPSRRRHRRPLRSEVMASVAAASSAVSPRCPRGQNYFKVHKGLRFINASRWNRTLNVSRVSIGRASAFATRCESGLRTMPISGDDEIMSHPVDNVLVGQTSFVNGQDNISTNTLDQVDAVEDDNNSTYEFLNYDDEPDLDYPTEGFSSIPEAIDDIRQGKIVIVVDDEDRENEGDLIMAASLVKPDDMAFIVRHGTGIVCVSMKGEDLERLQLPLMVTQKENDEKLSTAFTVSVDAKVGTTTGVSAKDRAKTVLDLASPDSKPEDFNRPGHIFPLKYREGGVLKRAGHTEASVDLAMLAGLPPVAVLCEIVDDDGSMARLPKLREFAYKENLKIISIADLIRYRRKREKLVERASVARLPLKWGSVQAYCYRSLLDGMEHIVMVKGDIGDGQDVLVRVHSECLTGDIFGSTRCDCGNQLDLAMELIEKAGRGVLVYLRGHEGRGIGLGHKLRAYNLQDDGRDTVEANEELGLPVDSREYGIGAQILRDLGVRTMKLLTNNPAKYIGLKGYGLSVVGRVPLLTPITKENQRYLETKRKKMGHVYGSKFNGSLNGVIESSGEVQNQTS